MERLKYSMNDFRVEISFWYELERKKLRDWRLSEPHVRMLAFDVTSPSSFGVSRSLVSLRAESLSSNRVDVVRRLKESQEFLADTKGGRCIVTGAKSSRIQILHDGFVQNFNTAEQLRHLSRCDALLKVLRLSVLLPLYSYYKSRGSEGANEHRSAEELSWEDVNFSIVALFTYADLKKHQFLYSVAFPVLDLGSPVFIRQRIKGGYRAAGSQFGDVYFPSVDTVDRVHLHLLNMLREKPERGPNPFVVIRGTSNSKRLEEANEKGVTFLPFSPAAVEMAMSHSLPMIVTLDYSAESSPGWPARSIVSVLRLMQSSLTCFALYCVRSGGESESVVFHCTCEQLSYTLRDVVEGGSPVRAVGWVETKGNKNSSHIHFIDLGPQMSPGKMADASAGLNLNLMKWRMLPELDLDGMAQCKALLLGTGTLGCNVARQLLMWGVRNITLVDRGNVSFSNPVRQILFELSDVYNPRMEERNKAVAAAKALKRILPTVNARGVHLTIHMPGHRVDKACEEEFTTETETLDELVRSHDVVFLLTDSREARWLPTLLATAHNKPTINVALAFDTYVVMRHGVDVRSESSIKDKPVRLGCYFCSDVVGPHDTITARTLDQQCTVTRPGVSAIASATAVELLAQLYNHPLGFACPPYVEGEGNSVHQTTGPGSGCATCPLGTIPQQIRGSIAQHSVYTLHGYRYEQCTACSDAIVTAYMEEGPAFVLKCINNPTYIEEVSGVKAFKESCVIDSFDDWGNDDDDNAGGV